MSLSRPSLGKRRIRERIWTMLLDLITGWQEKAKKIAPPRVQESSPRGLDCRALLTRQSGQVTASAPYWRSETQWREPVRRNAPLSQRCWLPHTEFLLCRQCKTVV